MFWSNYRNIDPNQMMAIQAIQARDSDIPSENIKWSKLVATIQAKTLLDQETIERQIEQLARPRR